MNTETPQAAAVMAPAPDERAAVLVEQIVPYAKKSCVYCYGTGVHARWIDGKRVESVCPGAVKRFMKATGAKIDMNNGQMYLP